MYGDYTIVTRISNYTNPTNTGQNRRSDRCCDNERESDDTCINKNRCDNRFTFCLKVFDDMTNGIHSCIGQVFTSDINGDDAPIDFTQPRWLGLNNPLRLNGVGRMLQVYYIDGYICAA